MNIPKITKRFETSLASALSAAGTSFTLESASDEDGNALSGLYGMTIDIGNSNVEDFIVTISGDTATVVYRGIDADAPNTEVTANKKSHRRGAPVVITDYPILAVLRLLANGEEGFPNPLKYAPGVAPVSADDLVDKAYADALMAGGTLSYDRVILAGTAGETVASGNLVYLKVSDGRWWLCDADTAATVDNVMLGIAQGSGTAGNAVTGGVLIKGLATNMTGLTANTKYYASNTAGTISTSAGTVEVSVGFALSTTSLMLDSRFDQQLTENEQDAVANLAQAILPYAADAQASDTYVVTLTPAPTAYTAGMVVHFKANTVTTGAATLNVNGLGAKTIVKSLNLTLHDGDIKAGQIVSVIYDGTNFQLLSPVTSPYASGVTTRALDATSGAVTIAHGLGAIPKRIKIEGVYVGSSTTDALQARSVGTYDGTNNRCIYTTRDVGSAGRSGTSTSNIVQLEQGNDSNGQTAVATFDATNITLTWTKQGTPTSRTIQILWEAFSN